MKGVFSVDEKDKLDVVMTFVKLCRNPPEGYRLSTIVRDLEIMFPMYTGEQIMKELRPVMYEMVKALSEG